MLNWPAAQILEKNKLASDAPFLALFKLTSTSIGDPIYLARNTEDVTWNNQIWEAYPIMFGPNTVDNQETPSLDVQVSNCGGILQQYLQQYNGLAGAEVTIYIVHASYLSDTTPLQEFDFAIDHVEYDEQWITFKLAASPEIMNRFPFASYMAQYCPYKFKSIRCGYNGSGDFCKNTADTCLITSRFGGEEGMNSV